MRTKTGNGQKVDLEKLLDDLKVVVRDGEQLLKVGANTFKERAMTAAQSTDRVVRENPYRTVAVVFGVGIAIGLIAMGFFRSGSDVEEDSQD